MVRIGYLMNMYPTVSATFIGREIRSLEAKGFQISRFAFRRWDGTLVDPLDAKEQARTDYLLDDGAISLLVGLVAETARNLKGVVAAFGLWRKLLRAAGGPFGGAGIKHVAYFLEAVALRRRLRRNPVAHIHCHFSSNVAAVALMVKAMGGPSYSFTVHGPSELFDPESNSLGLKIEHAAFVSCISHFCRSQCMIFAPIAAWDRLRIVHCGVRPSFYGEPPETTYMLPQKASGGRGLFVGRLSQLKGGVPLIQAMSLVNARIPDAELLIIGDGDTRPILEKMVAEAKLDHVIKFLGFRSQTDVRNAMATADCLILPSFAEGVPVTLMEAMASALPVIASRIAGVPELVEDGVSGYLVPPGDVETLADRMCTVLQDAALRTRMGEAGRAMVREEFDIDSETAWLGTLLQAVGESAALPPGLRPGAKH